MTALEKVKELWPETCHGRWMDPEYEEGLVSVIQMYRRDQDWKDVYIPRLVWTAHHLQDRGLEVKIVQREYNEGDIKLVDTLAEELDGAEVVRDFDPRVLKGVLGEARIVVGSRFHSLVSTLSMGVPAIALGVGPQV
ncbi:MAG: polysaccharide pyruvyl transferase family protein [Candidatus Brocadiia bacterium]